MSVKLELTADLANLCIHALREMAGIAQSRLDSGEANCGHDQPGQLQWLAAYIEHKLRDSK